MADFVKVCFFFVLLVYLCECKSIANDARDAKDAANDIAKFIANDIAKDLMQRRDADVNNDKRGSPCYFFGSKLCYVSHIRI